MTICSYFSRVKKNKITKKAKISLKKSYHVLCLDNRWKWRTGPELFVHLFSFGLYIIRSTIYLLYTNKIVIFHRLPSIWAFGLQWWKFSVENKCITSSILLFDSLISHRSGVLDTSEPTFVVIVICLSQIMYNSYLEYELLIILILWVIILKNLHERYYFKKITKKTNKDKYFLLRYLDLADQT